jgi:hypothetical protein
MTVTVVVLVALGFLTVNLLRPFVPAPPPNDEALSHGDYLAKNAKAQVRWQAWKPGVLEEARLRKRPILLTIGIWGSPAALYLDRKVFNDPEVAEQINRSFIPVRIDLEEQPEWQGVILPLQKAARLPDQGFEMVVLHPDKGIASWTAKLSGGSQLDFTGIVRALTQSIREADRAVLPLQEQQEREISQLLTLATGMPESGQMPVLATRLRNDSGILIETGKATLRPWLWNGLAAGGEIDSAIDSFLAWASSPMMEAAAVSFFSFGDFRPALTPEPVKRLEPNLDAMIFCARAARVQGRSDLAYLAVRMGDGIQKEFFQDKFVASTLIGEDEARPGSNRFAVRASLIWDKFTLKEQRLLSNGLNVDILRTNPAPPSPASLAAILTPSVETERIQGRLLQFRLNDPPERSRRSFTLSTALASSRLREAGALLDQPAWTLRSDELLKTALEAWRGDKVHVFSPGPWGGHSLAAGLTLAEALLAKWNLNGDRDSLNAFLKLMNQLTEKHRFGRGAVSGPIEDFEFPGYVTWPINSFDGATRSEAAIAVELLAAAAALTKDKNLMNLASEERQRWQAQAMLASPVWMGLTEAVIKTSLPPVMVKDKSEWLTVTSRDFSRLVLRRSTPDSISTGSNPFLSGSGRQPRQED